MIFIIISLIIINGFLYFRYKKQNEHEAALLSNKLDTSLELKKTMAMGLYFRFSFTESANPDDIHKNCTNLFIQQQPLEFEDFVASIYKKKFGGDIFVTRPSGDFGVDFEHNRTEGLFLGQVKAYKGDIDYKPIAILHSNMIKQQAKGGYFITTSSFNENAKKYAEGLNIELIDGVMLVEDWLQSMEQTVYSLNTVLPS